MKSPSLNNSLNVDNLACVRGERMLFKKLAFKLSSGQLLYVQGENGSGKTTLLRSLCGLSHPEVGKIIWNNQAIKALAEDYYGQVLYIGHLPSIKDDLTALENIEFSVVLSGYTATREQAISALEQLGAARCADLPTRVLSQGQKRRIALAQLWLQNDPDKIPLWILDEPFTALDTNMITVLTQHIEAFVNRGGMVVLTSHQVPEFTPSLVHSLTLGKS